VAIEMMRRQGEVVEQMIVVTDEGENSPPYFTATLKRYREELRADPHIVFVKTQNAVQRLERECRAEQIDFDAYQFAGDYYALPNLLPLLTRPSKMDLLMEVLEYPLPVRKSA
jgi:superfamily II DNA/RNA helicase